MAFSFYHFLSLKKSVMHKFKKKIETIKMLIREKDFYGIGGKVFSTLFGNKNTSMAGNFSYFIDKSELSPKFEKALVHLQDILKDKNNIGDYLEFGVCHGSSFICMHEMLEKLELDKVRLFGFDSFQGLPDEAANQDDGIWLPGSYYAHYEKVKKRMSKAGVNWDKAILTKGWFKDTLKSSFIEKNKIEKASIIMIDCDIYSAAKEALTFCAPLIKDNSIIFFDDWNSSGLASKNLGEKKAFDEFLIENPHLKSLDFGSYSFFGKPHGEIKIVSVG